MNECYVYVWERVSYMSHNYHDDGAVLIVAPSLDDARRAWLAHCETLPSWVMGVTRAKILQCELMTMLPDRVFPTVALATEVRCYPNAGCC